MGWVCRRIEHPVSAGAPAQGESPGQGRSFAWFSFRGVASCHVSLPAPATLMGHIPIPIVAPPRRTSAIDRQCDLYARGRITIEVLEKRLETVLLAEAPVGTPVPEGWVPPAPCRHEWLNITEFGLDGTRFICKWCGDEIIEDRVFRN